MFTRKKTILYITVTTKILLLVAIGFATAAFIHASNAVYLSDRIVDVSHRINLTVLGAETGQRGYIITDQDSYLESYNYAVANLDGQLNDLNLSSEAAGTVYPQTNSVNDLAHRKMDELYETIKLRKTKSFEAAQKLVASGSGQDYMLHLEHMLNQIIDKERVRTEHYEEIIRWTGFLIIGGLVGFSILAIITVFIARGAVAVVTYPIDPNVLATPMNPQNDPNA